MFPGTPTLTAKIISVSDKAASHAVTDFASFWVVVAIAVIAIVLFIAAASSATNASDTASQYSTLNTSLSERNAQLRTEVTDKTCQIERIRGSLHEQQTMNKELCAKLVAQTDASNNISDTSIAALTTLYKSLMETSNKVADTIRELRSLPKT